MITQIQEILAVDIGLNKINQFFPGITFQLSTTEPKPLAPGEAHASGEIQQLVDHPHGATVAGLIQVEYYGLTQSLHMSVHIDCLKSEGSAVEWDNLVKDIVAYIQRKSQAALNPGSEWFGHADLLVSMSNWDFVLVVRPDPVPVENFDVSDDPSV